MKRNKQHGAGNLTLRGGKWQARWTFGGKTYWRSTGTGNRKEAEKRLAEFVADFQLDGEEKTLQRQIARLGGVREQIRQARDLFLGDSARGGVLSCLVCNGTFRDYSGMAIPRRVPYERHRNSFYFPSGLGFGYRCHRLQQSNLWTQR